jgi:hypothetical protein
MTGRPIRMARLERCRLLKSRSEVAVPVHHRLPSLTMTRDKSVELTHWLPGLHVLRTAGLAMSPRRLLLAGLASLVFATGMSVIAELPFAIDPRQAVAHGPEAANSGITVPLQSLADKTVLLGPVLRLLEGTRTWSELAYHWTVLLWGLMVWSLAGGALSRMVALEFARGTTLRLIPALRFSARQWLSYLHAALLPASLILLLGIGHHALAGLCELLPGGRFVMGLSWGLTLISSLIMALLALGTSLGWPLMVAAVSTEDSDGFDGLSRAFGYLYDRLWYTGLLCAMALMAGVAGWFLLTLILSLTLHLAAVTTGTVPQTALSVSLMESLPAILHRTPRFPDESSAGGACLRFWHQLVLLIHSGYVPAWFWSSATVIYFLLRRADDGTSLDEVNDVRDQPGL